MSFHGAAVAKPLPADVASECLDACVLNQVSLQTVRRRKPATTAIAVIGIGTLVHLHVPSEACPFGESLHTLTTLMSQISQYRHPHGVRRHSLEHKQASVRHLQASVRHLHASVRHLQAMLGTLNISSQSSPSPWDIWQVRQVNKVSNMFEFAKSHG